MGTGGLTVLSLASVSTTPPTHLSPGPRPQSLQHRMLPLLHQPLLPSGSPQNFSGSCCLQYDNLAPEPGGPDLPRLNSAALGLSPGTPHRHPVLPASNQTSHTYPPASELCPTTLAPGISSPLSPPVATCHPAGPLSDGTLLRNPTPTFWDGSCGFPG